MRLCPPNLPVLIQARFAGDRKGMVDGSHLCNGLVSKKVGKSNVYSYSV